MKRNAEGFGYIPEEIKENYRLEKNNDIVTVYHSYSPDGNDKKKLLSISSDKFILISENVKTVFNQYLDDMEIRHGRFSRVTIFNRVLGKALMTLLYAIEIEEDKKKIEEALRSWINLEIAEKNYIHTMINADLSPDPKKGWRAAVKFIMMNDPSGFNN